MRPIQLDAVPDIHFYQDLNGDLIPLMAGRFNFRREGHFLVGIEVNGNIRPLFDRLQKMIMVDIETHHNVPMSIDIAQRFGFVIPYH